jgi:hypothetical protein
MGIGEVIIWYLIISISFVLTTVFTVLIPSWSITKEWAEEYDYMEYYPPNSYIVQHSIVYIIMSTVIFPVLLVAVLFANDEVVRGFTKAMAQSIIDKKESYEGDES